MFIEVRLSGQTMIGSEKIRDWEGDVYQAAFNTNHTIMMWDRNIGEYYYWHGSVHELFENAKCILNSTEKEHDHV